MCFTPNRRNRSDACGRGWNQLRRSSRRRRQKSKHSNLVRDDWAHLTPTLLIPYWSQDKHLGWCLMFAFLTNSLGVSSGGCSSQRVKNPALPTNINSALFYGEIWPGGRRRSQLSHLCRAAASRTLPAQRMHQMKFLTWTNLGSAPRE